MEEREDAVEARAEALAEALDALKYDLVAVRRQNGLDQSEVAERLCISQSAVSQFEHYDANPTLATVRRYALAVGARLRIEVVNEAQRRAECIARCPQATQAWATVVVPDVVPQWGTPEVETHA